MTVLVTGATGTIGSALVERLVAAGASVTVLVRNPGKARFPAQVAVVRGDMADVASVREVLRPVRTLFLLNAVAPDELNQALVMLNLAHEVGIERIVYLSVTRAHDFTNVPHFAAKAAAERMIEEFGLAASILRPNYFIQNDTILKTAIHDHGVYPMPIGVRGLSMLDTRDIADAAAHEILRRDRAEAPLSGRMIELGGPDVITGVAAAELWSRHLGRPVRYGGDDPEVWAASMRGAVPEWMIYDLCLMMQRFQQAGLEADPQDTARLADLLGHPLRTYEAFVASTAAHWQEPE